MNQPANQTEKKAGEGVKAKEGAGAITPFNIWRKLLGGGTLAIFLGLALFIVIVVCLFMFLPLKYVLIGFIVLLIWIGPIVLYIPFLFVLAISYLLSGDYSIPLGCGRNESGRVVCL
jgi:hypothetical protein